MLYETNTLKYFPFFVIKITILGLGGLANEHEKGINEKDIKTNTGTSSDHFIFSFFYDISTLQEGTYKTPSQQLPSNYSH